MTASPNKDAVVRNLIAAWEIYRGSEPKPTRYLTLKSDLYKARNGDPAAVYPIRLISTDNEVMAAVEHYFLCRAWVGNGIQPAWQMRAMKSIYNVGKELGVTPRHNPNNPVTPPSALQVTWQNRGIADGEADLKASGKSAPRVAMPPTY